MPTEVSAESLSKRSSRVWVVIAAYQEGSRLGNTLRGLQGLPYHLVVVDDGSRDDTSAVALGFPEVWLLRHALNLGQGAALQTGIDFALAHGAEYLVTFDADGQHVPEEIAKLLAPIQSGAVDVTLGSRFLGSSVGLPWTRWLVLKLGVLFTRCFSRIPVTDTHNGLRAFSRRAAQAIRITQNRMAHASEILDKIAEHQLRFCEVPVTIHYTDATLIKGQSSWNALRIVSQLILGRIVR